MKKTRLAISVLLTAFLGSCSHYYYVPNGHNVPLFREKKDLRLAAGIGFGGEKLLHSTLVQAQGAYSVTDHWAVSSSFMSVKDGDKSHDTSSSWGSGNYLDGAAGYYHPFGENWVFEVFGGFGHSSQHHQYELNGSGGGTADLSFTKLFLQPSFGYTHKYFDVAVSTRVSQLSFYKINDRMNPQHGEHIDLQNIMQNRNSWLFEPGIVLRGGWKYIKIQWQWGYSWNLPHPELKFENFSSSFGLYLTITPELLKID